MELAIKIQQSGNLEELAWFFSIAWELWRRRNKLVYERVKIEPKAAIEEFLAYNTSYNKRMCPHNMLQTVATLGSHLLRDGLS